jgi:ribosome-binding protein aMBF1 (putative translation factor)
LRVRTDSNINIVALIKSLMESEGRDFSVCELCGATDIKGEIHHMKYDGATYYDLRIACRKCQMQPHNKGLA